MERARLAVKDFMSKAGQHDTTIHEQHHAAVTRETVNPTRHERVTTAIDREIHQDHHHTTILPINHQETLPEQHHHNFIPVEHKNFEHDNAEELRQSLETERAQFKDTSERIEGEHTNETIHAGVAEHVHHHVHTYIQPVIYKRTIEPHIVHTVISIHETHHNKAKHHASTTLAPMSMEDFLSGGGTLKGDMMKMDNHGGCPKGAFNPHDADSGVPTVSSLTRSSSRDKKRNSGDSGVSGLSWNDSEKTKVSELDPGSTLTDAERAATTAYTRSRGGPLNSHKHSYSGPLNAIRQAMVKA